MPRPLPSVRSDLRFSPDGACRFLQLVFAAFLLALSPFPAMSGTVVRLGEVRAFSSPADLDLEGDIVYAINFSPDDPPRPVRGITFVPDTSPPRGVTLVGPQNVVAWQNRPQLGGSADALQLAEIMHDIRWANSGSGERLRASLSVLRGEEYRLQVLISANSAENRRWDIRVDGREAVDEISSLGVQPGSVYAANRCVLFTCTFVASSSLAVVEMGNLFGSNDGGDRNPIWQALTLERITTPPAPTSIELVGPRLFQNHAGPIAGLRVVDGKHAAQHLLELVVGEGDTDNRLFTLSGTNLMPSPVGFAGVAPGTTLRFRLRATDASAPERSLELPLSVTLIGSRPPTRVTTDALAISQRALPTALVARLSTDDPDAFDAVRYELVPGEGSVHHDLVMTDGASLRLRDVPPADTTALRVRVRATDQSGQWTETALEFPRRAPRLLLSEVVATRTGGVLDESAQPTEWLELANSTDHYESLAGWHLSDERGTPRKWPFPAIVLRPRGFQIVLADGSGIAPEGSDLLHASFSLSSEGEWVGLIPPETSLVGDEWELPALFPGVAYGRGPDGQLGLLAEPTPGAPNGAISAVSENRVVFSRERGFADQAFTLELSATLMGSTIRYTLDGTLPTPSSGLVYNGPIQIRPSGAAITRGLQTVRALAVHPEAAYARVATHTYLFVRGTPEAPANAITNQSRLTSSIVRHATYGPLLDDAFLALPALAVTVPQGLSQAERRASIELIDPSAAETGFQAECGLAATGTTSLGSPKLSMAARFRSEYGQSRLRYPVYARGSMAGAGAAEEFKELRLRSHSHDTFFWLGTRENPPVPYGNPPVTRSGDAQLVRNLWMEEMQLLMGQPGKHGRQVHLFLNGSYHGIYHIQEHADHDFMASYFPGTDREFHFTGAATTGSEHGPADTWRIPWSRVKASLTSEAEARRWIDVTNLCDYLVLSFYAGNDWDWSAQHNWSAAGPKEPDRGGWKFFQQDSDIALQDVNADCTDQDVPDGLFNALMRFPDFRVLFRDRVQRHLFGQGVLTPGRAAALYNARMAEIQTAIVAETARWQPSSSIATLPWDRDQEWTNEWRYLRDTFFPQRAGKLLDQLRRRSGWWPAEPPVPTFIHGPEPAAGILELTIPGGRGTVYYTLDGTDPRLPGGAISPAALTIGANSPVRTLIPTGALWHYLDSGIPPASAWVQRDYDDRAWKSGPAQLGYGDGDEKTVLGFVDADAIAAGVQKNLTTWLRHRFTLPDPAQITSLGLRLLCDDGAAVYLNGTELSRLNLLLGELTPDSRAITAVGGADESTFIDLTIPDAHRLLVPGENVVAVELHQNSPDSSDVSFDLELTATVRADSNPSGISLMGPSLVMARTRFGSEWSAMAEGYLVPQGTPAPSAANVALTEIHYHPAEDGDAEFLEFHNPTRLGVDLSGCTLDDAIRFRFPEGTALGAGERIVVTRDPQAFDRFVAGHALPDTMKLRRFGPWEGALSNGGETLKVRNRDGQLLYECSFGTRSPWPTTADGAGPSLERQDDLPLPNDPAQATARLNAATEWHASLEHGGTPGRAPSSVLVGTYSAWASQQFPPGTPSSEQARHADFDGDGMDNLSEYLFATSPTRADAASGISVRRATLQYVEIESRLRAEPVEYQFLLEISSDLTRWRDAGADVIEVAREPNGMGELRLRMRIPLPEGTDDPQNGVHTSRFLRWRATLDP